MDTLTNMMSFMGLYPTAYWIAEQHLLSIRSSGRLKTLKYCFTALGDQERFF
jgi:hypothetical protein